MQNSIDLIFLTDDSSSGAKQPSHTQRVPAIMAGNPLLKTRMDAFLKASETQDNPRLQIYRKLGEIKTVSKDQLASELKSSTGAPHKVVVLDEKSYVNQTLPTHDLPETEDDELGEYFLLFAASSDMSGISEKPDEFPELAPLLEKLQNSDVTKKMLFIYWFPITKRALGEFSGAIHSRQGFVGVGIDNLIYFLEQQMGCALAL